MPTTTVTLKVHEKTRLLYTVQYDGSSEKDKLDAVEDLLWARLLDPEKNNERIVIGNKEKVRILVQTCDLSIQEATMRVQKGGKRVVKKEKELKYTKSAVLLRLCVVGKPPTSAPHLMLLLTTMKKVMTSY